MEQPKTVFNPQEASNLAIESINDRRNEKQGLKIGLPTIDNYLIPMRKSQLIGVMGYTSHYKSGFMSFVANKAIGQLEDENDVIIYVSWEQSVEEQIILDIARTSFIDAGDIYRGKVSDLDFETLARSAVLRASKPLWIIGHSEAGEKRRPRLTMTDMANALVYLTEKEMRKPKLIVLDYLQRINRDDASTGDMRGGFMEIVDRAKDMAIAFACPVILGTQAKRDVIDRKWKQPIISDAQETSNFEQSCDVIFSTWFPKNTEPIGSTIGPGGNLEYEVTENLLLIQLLKQKQGQAPILFPMFVKPATNEMYSLADYAIK